MDVKELEDIYSTLSEKMTGVTMTLWCVPTVAKVLMETFKDRDQEKFFKVKFIFEELKTCLLKTAGELDSELKRICL